MAEALHPIGFLNGQFIEADRMAVSVADAGFVLGATVTEQLRTFGGKLYRPADHLRRLRRSLQIVGIDPSMDDGEFQDAAERLVQHNHPLLDVGDDLGLTIFVTPGLYPALSQGRRSPPTIGLHTHPLAFQLWEEKYRTGQRLTIPSIRQVPASSWPAELKCRSRMHYYLADRMAKQNDPESQALLLDQQGDVCETATANVVAHFAHKGLVSPPRNAILPGVSLAALAELASELAIPFRDRAVTPHELLEADEILLTSTPYCILPAVAVDGTAIGGGAAGTVFQRLLKAWSERVGIDISAQARSFANGGSVQRDNVDNGALSERARMGGRVD